MSFYYLRKKLFTFLYQLFVYIAGTCAMADGCYYEEDADSIQRIFTQNFLDHYTGDKTPFPLFFHSAWFFNRPHRQEGFFKFVDSILALPDVYFVTVSNTMALII